MFEWLSSRLKKNEGDTHPFSTEAGLHQSLAEATVGAASNVLRTLTEFLEDLAELELQLSPEARIRALLHIEDQAREFLSQRWDQLFPPSPATTLSDDVWLSLANYYRHSAAAATAALTVFPQEELESSRGRQRMARLILTALQSRYSHEKLQRFRYRPADASLWSDYASLYQTARKLGINAMPLTTPGNDRETTLQAVLLKALMLEVAPLENLSPEQIQCLDLFLERDVAMLVQRAVADARSPFVFAGSAPTRVNPTQLVADDALYFGPGLAYNDLQRILSALEKDKSVDWLEQAPGTTAQKTALFRMLKACWSDTPPQRQSPRQSSEGKLLVVHGFTQVRRMVAAAAFARSGRQLSLYSSYQSRAQNQDEYFGTVSGEEISEPDETPLTPLEVLQRLELAGDREQMEQWLVADSSSKGLGLVVPQQKRWLKVGTLLSFRRNDALQWEVAVIRRLGRNGQGQRIAGLLLFPGLAEPVSLRLLKEGEPVHAGRDSLADFRDGILLSQDDASLLLEADLGQAGNRLLLLAQGQRQAILIEEVLESRDDFKRVRYRPESPE